MSFGRKGLIDAQRLTPGQVMALRAQPQQAAASERESPTQADDEMSPALAAFLAAERARNGQKPGLSDVALGIHRPASDISDLGNDTPRGAGGISLSKGSATRPALDHPATREVTIVHRAERTLLLAYVLWFFTGGFSGHRHYLGRHGSALAQTGLYWLGMAIVMAAMFGMNAGMLGVGIVIAGGAGWWIFIDAFLIPGMVRQYNAGPKAATFA